MEHALTPMTVRLESNVNRALAERARKAGQETADYAADVLARDAMPELEATNFEEAQRVQAELELKKVVIAFAVTETNRNGFSSDITLKAFKYVKTSETVRLLYERAIGGRPGDERGNPIKHRINRNLGAAIKTALHAAPQTINGNPVKAQVSGEFIRSYTPLVANIGE